VSNAWLLYVGPLVVATAFVMVGVISFGSYWRGGRDADGQRKVGASAIVSGVFVLGVGGTLGLAILLTAPTPTERERLFDHTFRTPPERIERFIIKGANPADEYKPLTTTDVVIDDPARIRLIAEILRAATEILPNHPHSRWTANIEMVTRDGTYYFSVNRTAPGHPDGVLVAPWQKERGGWNLGDWRTDGLDKILEDAVNKARKPD
jgi:hypothetical protein